MAEMIERVARAICAASGSPDPDEIWNGHPLWEEFSDDARAAIEAMREPTEPMMQAAESEAEAYFGNGQERLEPEQVWRVMIDAALK
jgi:hypothetical protein